MNSFNVNYPSLFINLLHELAIKMKLIVLTMTFYMYMTVCSLLQLVDKAKGELLKVRKKSQRKKPTEKFEDKEKQVQFITVCM